MSLNLLKIVFGLESFGVLLTGFMIIFFGRYLPTEFSDFCLYGKLGANFDGAILNKFKLQKKKCFRHFYIFSGPLSSTFLLLLCCRYYLNVELPAGFIQTIKFFLDDPLKASIPVENVILSMIILTIHCWKRFYECHYVNVFSDVYMNVFMYVLGLFYYLGAVISIVGEAQYLSSDVKVDLNWTRLTLLEYTCLVISLLSTYLQLRASVTFANLRKDKSGIVVTKKYGIPRGELFEFISAPQELTEIILYVCLYIILRMGSTFHYITLLVIINQAEHAYLSHRWYLKKFEDYPKSRKIIIPFIF